MTDNIYTLALAAADGCLENAPDTAEFSRQFQNHQNLFDPVHDYAALPKWVSVRTSARERLSSSFETFSNKKKHNAEICDDIFPKSAAFSCGPLRGSPVLVTILLFLAAADKRGEEKTLVDTSVIVLAPGADFHSPIKRQELGVKRRLKG